MRARLAYRLLTVGGFALLAFGIGLVSVPAALIVAGAIAAGVGGTILVAAELGGGR